jgi:hypothetical protein
LKNKQKKGKKKNIRQPGTTLYEQQEEIKRGTLHSTFLIIRSQGLLREQGKVHRTIPTTRQGRDALGQVLGRGLGLRRGAVHSRGHIHVFEPTGFHKHGKGLSGNSFDTGTAHCMGCGLNKINVNNLFLIEMERNRKTKKNSLVTNHQSEPGRFPRSGSRCDPWGC